MSPATKPKTIEEAADPKTADDEQPDAEAEKEAETAQQDSSPSAPEKTDTPEPEAQGEDRGISLPTVAILLLTYEPGGEGKRGTADKTLAAALKHVSYSGPLILHIADDGSVEGHVAALWTLAGKSKRLDQVTQSNAERGGYGASYNLATQTVHRDAGIVLVLEDDWELQRDLDLDPLVEALVQGREGVNCLRLGYLGWTADLRGSIRAIEGLGKGVLLDPDSPERHVYAGHPRLETVGFQREIGEWPVGLAPGATEFEVCGRPASRRGVFWPWELNPDGELFAHIGTVSTNGTQPGE